MPDRSDNDVLTPDVVAGVSHHMNDDHVEDALRIVQGLGGVRDATSATLVDLTPRGAVFSASTPDQTSEVTVDWARPILERADIRLDIVRMHEEACANLGITPEPGGEHG